MTNLTRSDLTIKNLFGLDDRQDVERIEISQSVGGSGDLYLLQCDTILAEGKLAIDEHQGIVGVYQKKTIAHKTEMNTLEIAALTLLVLSRPLPVSRSTLQNLYMLYMMNARHDIYSCSEPIENAVQAFVINCNEKLCSLGVEIEAVDAAYHLTDFSKVQKGCK